MPAPAFTIHSPRPASVVDFQALFPSNVTSAMLVQLTRARMRLMSGDVSVADAEAYLSQWDFFVHTQLLNRRESIRAFAACDFSWTIHADFGGDCRSSLVPFETAAAALCLIGALCKEKTVMSLSRAETLCRWLLAEVLVTVRSLFTELRQHPLLAESFFRGVHECVMGSLFFERSRNATATRPALLIRSAMWFGRAAASLPHVAALSYYSESAKCAAFAYVGDMIAQDAPQHTGVAIAMLNRAIERHPSPPEQFAKWRDRMIAANQTALGMQPVPAHEQLSLMVGAATTGGVEVEADGKKFRIKLPPHGVVDNKEWQSPRNKLLKKITTLKPNPKP